MSEPSTPADLPAADDVEGHRLAPMADGSAETDDSEGHRMVSVADGDETDDTEGHRVVTAATGGDEAEGRRVAF